MAAEVSLDCWMLIFKYRTLNIEPTSPSLLAYIASTMPAMTCWRPGKVQSVTQAEPRTWGWGYTPGTACNDFWMGPPYLDRNSENVQQTNNAKKADHAKQNSSVFFFHWQKYQTAHPKVKSDRHLMTKTVSTNRFARCHFHNIIQKRTIYKPYSKWHILIAVFYLYNPHIVNSITFNYKGTF